MNKKHKMIIYISYIREIRKKREFMSPIMSIKKKKNKQIKTGNKKDGKKKEFIQ